MCLWLIWWDLIWIKKIFFKSKDALQQPVIIRQKSQEKKSKRTSNCLDQELVSSPWSCLGILPVSHCVYGGAQSCWILPTSVSIYSLHIWKIILIRATASFDLRIYVVRSFLVTVTDILSRDSSSSYSIQYISTLYDEYEP